MSIITTSSFDPLDIHVYFLAGFPDLTSMERKGNYQEVTFWETTQEACHRVLGEIEHAAEIIKNTGAKVCFATIIPGNIEKWNLTRLAQKRQTKRSKKSRQRRPRSQKKRSS